MEARGIPGICHLSLFRSNLHADTCMIVFLLVPLFAAFGRIKMEQVISGR